MPSLVQIVVIAKTVRTDNDDDDSNYCNNKYNNNNNNREQHHLSYCCLWGKYCMRTRAFVAMQTIRLFECEVYIFHPITLNVLVIFFWKVFVYVLVSLCRIYVQRSWVVYFVFLKIVNIWKLFVHKRTENRGVLKRGFLFFNSIKIFRIF